VDNSSSSLWIISPIGPDVLHFSIMRQDQPVRN
jgi:hypothetical protein